MSDKGFTPADEIKVEPYEKQMQLTVKHLLNIFQLACDKAFTDLPEGYGASAEATVGICTVKISRMPPPPAAPKGGGWSGKQGSPIIGFDKAKAQAVVMEYPDVIEYKEEGDKAHVATKKFLGDQWTEVNDKLKQAGMAWAKGEKRWSQQ